MEDRWLPEEAEEVDLLVDLLDYVKSRWAPGHVPRVGLGVRVHPKQKREYALAFARSVDAAIARGNGHLRRAFPQPAEKQDKVKALTSSPQRKPHGRVEAAASKQHRELERAAEKGSSRQSREEAYGGGGDEMTDGEEERERDPRGAVSSHLTSSGRKGPRSSHSHAPPREVAESKGDASARVRFFEDKTWRPVECRIPWSAAKVGITVINHPVAIGGKTRSVLFVSVVSGHGTGAMAGVQQGDCVVEVEGRDVSGLACRDLLSCLRDMLRVKRHVDPSLTLRFLFARSDTPATDWAKASQPLDKNANRAGSTGRPRGRPPKSSLPRPISSSPAHPDPSSSSPVPPSSSKPQGQTYSVVVDLGKAGRVTEWCRPVTSDKTGKRYYVVVETRETPEGARVNKGDILMTAAGHEVAKNQEAGLGEVLSRLGGKVELSFWTAKQKRSPGAQEAEEAQEEGREGEKDGDKGQGMELQASNEEQEAEKEKEQPPTDGGKSDSDRISSDSEDNGSASNGSVLNGSSSAYSSPGRPGGKGATRPREEGEDRAASEGPTREGGDPMDEEMEAGPDSPSTSIRLKRQKSHHGQVVYSVVEGEEQPQEEEEGEEEEEEEAMGEEGDDKETSSTQGDLDASMTDASRDGDRVVAHRGAASGAGASVEGDMEASVSLSQDKPHPPIALGDVVWARLGKLPRWPALVQELDVDASPPSAKVKFFGDWQLEKVGISGLESFEASFRKLFKKRYEKVYVQTVASAVQLIMTRDDLDYPRFSQRVGVWPAVLQKYMEEDALPKLEGDNVARLSRVQAQGSGNVNGNGTSRTQAMHKAAGGKKGAGEQSSDEPRWKQICYDIDPELFRETKKNGIKSEAWF